jgi:hypothetical protein
MGVKSKVASMQRGAQRRNRTSREATPDYQNFDPIMRTVDEAQLGMSYQIRETLKEKLKPILRSYQGAGFRKPHDICRLLNKSGARTATGDQWTPRLVWFLLKSISTPRNATSKRVVTKFESALIKRDDMLATVKTYIGNLTDEELERRLVALKAARSQVPHN